MLPQSIPGPQPPSLTICVLAQSTTAVQSRDSVILNQIGWIQINKTCSTGFPLLFLCKVYKFRVKS